MGIDYWMHWLAWFIRSMILFSIVNCFIILLLKISWFPSSEVSVLTYSSTMVLCAFFTIYSMANTTYCFMMSVFFSKGNFMPYICFLFKNKLIFQPIVQCVWQE